MEQTIVADWLHQDRIGYWVGFFLSAGSQQAIEPLLTDLSADLPGALWTMPSNKLHVTLFEIIMPMRDYGEDKDTMFSRHKEEIESNLADIFAAQAPISIKFDSLAASAETIIVKGSDDGTFQRLRTAASSRPIIQSGSRTPPDIIHSSLARYEAAVSLDLVRDKLASHAIETEEKVSAFSLCRVYRTPMETELLKTYPLTG